MKIGMFKIRQADIAVIIGTYGDDYWHEKGLILGKEIAEEQTVPPCETIVVHHDTLAEARNEGAYRSTAPYLCFVDADDALDQHFIEAMATVDIELTEADGAVRAIRRPAVRGFNADGWIDDAPVVGEHTSLIKQNFITIASVVPAWMFHEVNGFDPESEYPCLEDWAFWLKCWCRCNATVIDIPDAVYEINDVHHRSGHPDANGVARRIRQKFENQFRDRP